MKTEPITCSGDELASVLDGIRSRGGIVTALSTGVGGNAGYRVNYFLAAPEREARAVADALRTPKAGSNPAVATKFPQQVETPEVSIESRMAALHARMSATGKLIRDKPREWRLPYAD